MVEVCQPGDETAAYQVVQDAFDEWQQRRKSYPEWPGKPWRGTPLYRPCVPSVSPVAFAGDQMVGLVLSLELPEAGEAHIEQLAVRHDHRGREIARLLLRHAFRGFYRRGQSSCTLWTHSNTGVLSLYQRVGMTVRRRSTVYSRPLRG